MSRKQRTNGKTSAFTLGDLFDHPTLRDLPGNAAKLERAREDAARRVAAARAEVDLAELRYAERLAEGAEPDRAALDAATAALSSAERELRLGEAALEKAREVRVRRVEEVRDELRAELRERQRELVRDFDAAVERAIEVNRQLGEIEFSLAPRLLGSTVALPGFAWGLLTREKLAGWRDHVRSHGYEV